MPYYVVAKRRKGFGEKIISIENARNLKALRDKVILKHHADRRKGIYVAYRISGVGHIILKNI